MADREKPDNEDRDEAAIDEAEPVEPRIRFRLIGHRPGREQGHLTLLHDPVDRERDHRRHEQNHRNDGPHLEILLADHLLVDVDRQHVVLPADHLGQPEIGDDQIEDHESGRDQAIACARNRDGPERLPPARLQ